MSHDASPQPIAEIAQRMGHAIERQALLLAQAGLLIIDALQAKSSSFRTLLVGRGVTTLTAPGYCSSTQTRYFAIVHKEF